MNLSCREDSIIEKCVLRHRADASIKWLTDIINESCPIECLSDWNHGRLHVFYERNPFVYNIAVEICYNFIFGLLILLAIVGNLTVVWIVLRHERMRTVTNYYLLNLAIADLLITILNSGFNATYNLYYNWIFTDAHCAFNNFMGVTPICASVFTMIAMSIDRYLAIVYPLKRRPGKRKTLIIHAILFGIPTVAATTLTTIFIIDPITNVIYELRSCLDDGFPDGNSESSILFNIYNIALIILQYLLPLAILSYTYGRVATVLRRKDQIGDTKHQTMIKAKEKAANMLALVVILFNFMWLPYNVFFLIQYFGWGREPLLYLFINIYCIRLASCLVNPVIYYFMNEKFRTGFQYAFRWLPWVRIRHEDYMRAFSTSRSYGSNV